MTVDEFAEICRKVVRELDYPPVNHTFERYLKDFAFLCRRERIARVADVTADAVTNFVRHYLADAKEAGRDENSAKTSCNSILRNAGALFSAIMTEQYQKLGLQLINPFKGRKLRRVRINS